MRSGPYVSQRIPPMTLEDIAPHDPAPSHIAMMRAWLAEGHTSAELARAAGISQKHVSQVLLGKAVMRSVTIVAVSAVMDLDPYTLACGQAAWQIDHALSDLLRENA